MRSAAPRTVLFDLDGTLADTAPDLAAALNTLRAEEGLAPLPYATIRPVVSHGTTALIHLSHGTALDMDTLDRLRTRIVALYRENICRETRLFPGMGNVLDSIEAYGLNWGIVTNKPAVLTEPLLAALGLDARAACIVSGDSLNERKPHPAPMWHACHLAGSLAHECVYVGDAARDIEAGRAAGMHTLVALYGYIGTEDDPQGWGADALITTPAEIMTWLDTRRGQA